MKNISITVPMDYQALTQAAGMFRGLAETMAPPEATAERPATAESAVETLKEAAEVNIPTPEPEATPAPTPEPEATPAEVFAPAPEVAPIPEPEAVVTPGAALDVNGIPWDGRIHASTKTKTVDGAWKNKRGVDKDLLTQVEAELKAVMDIPVAAPLPEIVNHTEQPVTVTDGVSASTTPPAPPAAPGIITTFPALMTAITSNNIAPEVVSGAVQAVGLQSLPLLAARTDLIPQVAERLGL